MSKTETRNETADAKAPVPMELPASILTKRQRLKFGPKHVTLHGEAHVIRAEVRYDDECGNGHNSFSITGDYKRLNESWDNASGGCCHDEIALAFPELAPFIKWHLVSSDGPMHYLANVIYHAGDRDHNGRRKGEANAFDLCLKFKGFPLLWRGHRTDAFIKWLGTMGDVAADCEVLRIDHEEDPKQTYKYNFGPKYTLGGFGSKWYECPFDTEQEALAFVQSLKVGFEVVKIPTAWSEGKERDLAAARSCAAWPEVTDEQLSAEPEELKRMLLERLPAMMAQFKHDVESLGLIY